MADHRVDIEHPLCQVFAQGMKDREAVAICNKGLQFEEPWRESMHGVCQNQISAGRWDFIHNGRRVHGITFYSLAANQEFLDLMDIARRIR